MKKIISIACITSLIAACSNNTNNQHEKEETNTKQNNAVHYTLAAVTKENISAAIKLPAQLAAYREISIFPKVNGYVKKYMLISARR